MSTAPAAEIETTPSSEWMNGARAAQRIVTAQVCAGQTAEQIEGKWAEANAAYDDATATDAQRDWHAGAVHSAGELIETYRTARAADAAGVTRDSLPRDFGRAEHEHEQEAG
jgi:hypothetical protein